MGSKLMRTAAGITAAAFASAMLGGAAMAAFGERASAKAAASLDQPASGRVIAQTAPANTVTGRVGTTTAADGDREYTITAADGTVTRLDAGPPWFHDPLAAFIGQTVTVSGETGKKGELDVFTVAGGGQTTTIRPAEGRPAWAGGPAKVGAKHPGHAGYQRGKPASGP